MSSFKQLSIVGLSLLALGGWSAAGASTINFLTGKSNTWTVDGVTVTAKACSIFNVNDGPVDSSLVRYDTGLGVTNRRDNNSKYDNAAHWHTIDNKYGVDWVKLDFSTKVEITSIVIEVWRSDADLHLGYGDNWNDNLNLVQWDESKRTKAQSQEVTIDLTALGLSGNFDEQWRIFAQICGTDSKGNLCSGNDGFKLKSVTFSAVPIPAAVWLFGSAVIGMAGVGYRRKQSA